MCRCILILVFLTFTSSAANRPSNECANRGRYAEEMLLSAIAKDGVKGIVNDKTKVQLLNLSPVSDAFALELAHADTKNVDSLSFEYYYGIYHNNGAMNLTLKFILANPKDAKNIYIVSTLINNDECSVRFNGYLTLSREF